MSQASTVSSPPTRQPGAPVVSYGHRPPRRRKGINVRILLFFGIVALPLFGVFALVVRGMLDGGIVQHANYAEVDLKALGNFPFNPRTGSIDDVPARWRALNGKRIELKGFMFSPNSALRTRNFELVYNIQKCCFGGPPQAQERVFCHSAEQDGVELQDYGTEVSCVGILHVRVRRDKTGAIFSVFDLDVEHVAPM